ncbi:MAG: glycosyltransferase [Thermomicrobiales bacterium]|nr:glycosyltransferase [Thermomicrobiales bacterium]
MVSPVLPATTGNGLAMRAAMSVKALSRHGRLSLLVHQLYPSMRRGGLEPELASLVETLVVQDPRHPSTGLDRLCGPYDRVHAFRLSTIPVAESVRHRAGALHVDFDDLESRSHLRIAGLLRSRQRHGEAAVAERQSATSLAAEIEALSQFDRVYLANLADIDHLPFCGRADVRVLPNVVDPVALSPGETTRSGAQSLDRPFTFLFVGTLTYFPNEDGVRFFCEEVLPLLREQAGQEFRVKVVGLAPPSVTSLRGLPNVEITGMVPAIEPHYATAGAVIVPLRAGGGTRIKLLEAFAFGAPAVSTTIGAEGIAVRPGVECLIADKPESFAAACLNLMNDASLRQRLSVEALAYVQTHHSLDVAIAALS